MSIKVKNQTEYPTDEVRRIVRAVLRDLDADDVAVRVIHRRAKGDPHATGHYREYWFPGDGEDRPQIRISLPKPEVVIHAYVPYRRKEAPPMFALLDWREALVALVAHEGMHHRQTPRNYYRSSRKAGGGKRRYVEHECDWAAYRAVMRWREEQRC